MQILIDILVSFFGLSRSTWNAIDWDSLRRLHSRFIARIIWIIGILVVVMIALNYFKHMGINLIISLGLCMATLIIGTWPELIIATALTSTVSGVIRSPQTITDELERIFPIYIRTLGDVIFWTSIFGMFLGTVSCRNNPGAVLLITVALIVIGYGSWRWQMGPTIYKRVIYTYACGCLIFAILSLVPAHTWNHWVGHDLGSAFHVSQAEQALARVEAAQQQTEDEANAKILKSIEAKVATGQTLTQAERTFIAAVKAIREKESLPGVVKAKAGELKTKLDELKPKPAPTTPTAPAPVVIKYVPTATPAPAPAQTKEASAPQAGANFAHIPASGIWKMSFVWKGEKFEQDFTLNTQGSRLSLVSGGGTVIEGDLVTRQGSASYKGSPNGQINFSFSINEGSGEWKRGPEKISFTLRKTG